MRRAWVRLWCRLTGHDALVVVPGLDGAVVACRRCLWAADVTLPAAEPAPLKPGQVRVPAAELLKAMASISDGMDALTERVQQLETSLLIESSLLDAVLDRD